MLLKLRGLIVRIVKMRPATNASSSFHLTQIVYFSILQLSILMASDNCESSTFTKYFCCPGQFREFVLPGGDFFWVCKQNNFSDVFYHFSFRFFLLNLSFEILFLRKSFDTFELEFQVFIVHLLYECAYSIKTATN